MTREARFPRLEAHEMTSEQKTVAAEIAAGPRGEVRGPYVALLHHPALAGHLQRLGEQLRWKSTLAPRLVELAVLVTARRWTCQHEWLIHEKLARQAGLAPGLVAAIAEDRLPEAMGADEAAVYAFCRQVHVSGRAEDAAFEEARRRFGREGALELLVLSGYYSLMAMVLNTAGLPLPGGAQPPLR